MVRGFSSNPRVIVWRLTGFLVLCDDLELETIAELRNLVLQLLLGFREFLDLATLIIEFQLCSTLLYDLGKY